LRFYQRAIATYDEGLKKFPKSFDLAYNKALLLYNITQEKRIVSRIGPLLDVLKEALDAHKYALSIDQENADVLFNTAQVLTSFAEELSDAAPDDTDIKTQATSLIQEAVELFSACLSRQEMEFSEMQELMNETTIQPGSEQFPTSGLAEQSRGPTDEPEEWATVKEPVTPNTLIETALAQLGSLASLATIAAPTSSSLLANLSEIANPVVKQKLPSYIALLPTSVAREPDEPEATSYLSISASTSTFHANKDPTDVNPQASAQVEADLAIAVFTAAIAGAEYQSHLIYAAVYHERVIQAFQSMSQNLGSGFYPKSSHVPILSAYADALIEFAENVAEMDDSQPDPEASTLRWTALETAQAQLTQATNILPNTSTADSLMPSKAQVYFTRGNVELLRRRLTLLPSASSGLKSNEKVLLKNAGVYYRGAAALAKQDDNAELERDASFRNAVVQAIEQGQVRDSAGAVKEVFNSEIGVETGAAVDEMVQEGLLPEDE
jgi:tetratricopeptide (TPR) repeat protein